MRTNALQCLLAEALSRANSLAATSSADMAEVGGMLGSDAVVVEL
jgi:hypothetical protein